MKARTRFAPSPTGYMHVGGARTALFAWLVAKASGGEFILRIEDTDKSREVGGSEQHIKDSLEWLGLEWDEGPDKDGAHGPYLQSQRLDIYKKWGQKLIDSNRAYGDPYSPAELESFRQAAKDQKRAFLFRDHRPAKSPVWDGSMPLRFRSEPKAYHWEDAVLGKLSSGPEAIDDFILLKSDGFPTYNFAHIIDDHLMQISHVIRSQEFLPSVPRFLNLYEALDIKPPTLATLPYVMGPDGKKKLSKRDGAKDILDYRQEGYLPEALINFLATLGWNDGTEQELFSREELLAKFDLARVHKAGARFDEQRLIWMDGAWIRRLPLKELYERVEAGGFWPPSAKGAALYYKKEVLRLLQERLKFLAEIPDLSDFFFNDDYVLDRQLLISTAKNAGEPKTVLRTVKEELAQSDFSAQDLEQRLRQLVAKLKIKPQDLFGLIRVAVTGKTVAPGLWELLAALGPDAQTSKQKALTRLDRAMALLEPEA